MMFNVYDRTNKEKSREKIEAHDFFHAGMKYKDMYPRVHINNIEIWKIVND